jgi:hypothetical protein
VAVLCAVSWATLGLVVADGQLDLAYYSTVTRGGEILAGSLLALLWARPRHGARTPVPLTVAGIGALLVIAWACSTVAATGDGSYLAVLPLIAVATTVTIAASVRSGPVAAALSIRPLQLLGRLSYALYIVHWPVFVWLSPERTDLDQTPLAALRVGVSLLLAVAAFVLVERPVLRARPAKGHPVRVGAVAASFLFLVSGATVAIVGNVEPEVDLADQAAEFEVQTTQPAPGPTSTQPDVTAVPPAPVVAVLGDSTALRTGMGLDAWGTETEEMQVIGGVTTLGCGIEPPGARRVYPSQVVTDMSDTCSQALARWPSAVADSGASVAVIQVGPWDVADHQLSGTEEWQHVGEPAYDRILVDLIGSTVDQLLAAGAEHVVWIEPPPVILTRSPNYGSVMGPEGDPARMERLNEIAAEVASTRPQMRLVDLAARIERLGADDERVRPDGVHFTVETAAEVAAWLGPQILAAVRSG